MSNKLRNVFSNKLFELGCDISFQDKNARKQFLEALKIVCEEGCVVEIEGVSTISTNAKNGDAVYPLMVESNPTRLVVGPSIVPVTITVNTISGERKVEFQRYETNADVIMETGHEEIAFLKFIFNKSGHQIRFTYRMQPQYAKATKDVVEGYCVAIGVINRFFNDKNMQDDSNDWKEINAIKQSFRTTYSFWKKLSLIEDELNLLFNPAEIENVDDVMHDVEELYLLLVEKKAIHLNAKLTPPEAAGITLALDEDAPQVGHALNITFTNEISYTIGEQNIVIYAANLLSNAIIKEVLRTETGEIKILYDDTDSAPMYISYTGHKTPDEAEEEHGLIMKDKERTKNYKEALTVNEYFQHEADDAICQRE